MGSIKKRLVWQYSFIIIITVLILELFFVFAVWQFYYTSTEQLLLNRANVYTSFYKRNLPSYSLSFSNREQAQYIIENVSEDEPANVEVIDWQGNVVAASSGVILEKKIDTPDFRKAMQGQTGVWKGKHISTNERVMAVAIPFRSAKGSVEGVLRYVTSIEEIHGTIVKIITGASILGILVILLVITISRFLAKSIVNPIANITSVAEQYAHGNYTVKANKEKDDEIGKLAETLNYMSEEIKKGEQVKNEFLSSISHEMRTPLTSIKGWGETVLSGKFEDKRKHKKGWR